MTDIFLGLGKFFKWSFQALPPIGDLMNILISIAGIGILTLWCIELLKFGSENEKEYVKKDKFPFL